MQEASPQTTKPPQRWTVLSLVESATQHMVERGFDEARLHVELLLAHVLQFSRIQLYMNFDRPVAPEEMAAFKAFLQRRLRHEPLQYLLGETEFMGLALHVNPSVLIPRPETELLVERALQEITSLAREHVNILDIGTGSGNIAIAVAKFAPGARVTAIETSDDALTVARKNVERHKLSNVVLLRHDVFVDFLEGAQFDAVVSNPPYIALEEFHSLAPEVKDFEPRIATTDEADGFRFVRRVSDVAAKKLKAGGALFMEIAYNQSAEALQIASEAGLSDGEVFKDYAGLPRILTARKK